MGKKINVDKLDADRAPEEVEEAAEGMLETEAEKSSENSDQPDMVGGIDVSRIIKSTGGIQNAVGTAAPAIDQFAAQARLEAQRASTHLMKEYRRQMQGIVGSMQATIREEGVRLADEICVRIATQIRQAVLLETEKKALNLVDEFVLGWQIETESMSQDLLTASAEPRAEAHSNQPPEKPESVSADKEGSSLTGKQKAVETADKDAAVSVNPPPEKGVATEPVLKKPETASPERPRPEQTETEKKVVFDFATFIAQSKSPVKS
ncbi:MAG: hypothetical protein TUN42_09435 [Dehalogenimonas sp.]